MCQFVQLHHKRNIAKKHLCRLRIAALSARSLCCASLLLLGHLFNRTDGLNFIDAVVVWSSFLDRDEGGDIWRIECIFWIVPEYRSVQGIIRQYLALFCQWIKPQPLKVPRIEGFCFADGPVSSCTPPPPSRSPSRSPPWSAAPPTADSAGKLQGLEADFVKEW